MCKEAAALLCPNCATGLDVHAQKRRTYYCSKSCSAKDWAAGHKLECKAAIDRLQLFRIGSLVQEAFYQSSKATRFHDVARIKKIEHMERDDDPKLLMWRGEGQGGVEFPAFPDDLFEEDRGARATLAGATSAVTITDEEHTNEVSVRLQETAPGGDQAYSFYSNQGDALRSSPSQRGN